MPRSTSPILYRRRLPHWQPPERYLFLTWRLLGSPPPPTGSSRSGRDFVRYDRFCERTCCGPHWLKEPPIARIVCDSLRYAQSVLHLFELAAWVIMPNHVHLLLYPEETLERINRAVKGYTARQANQYLQRMGAAFWQHESWDHWVRSAGEFDRIRGYIEYNPVKAGLASTPEDWPWSSASRDL